MPLHSNKLKIYYEREVVAHRRVSDHIWDFMHQDERGMARRKVWLEPLPSLILADQPELLEMPGISEMLNWLVYEARPNVAEAFYYLCAWIFPPVTQFLSDETKVSSPSNHQLMVFLYNKEHFLPKLCRNFLEGRNKDPTIDAFVRNMRSTYIMCVGVAIPETYHSHAIEQGY